MSSIRGRLQTGMVLSTLAALSLAGLAADQGVRRTLLGDVDRSLRERARWVASTVELTPEGLELGFSELEMGEFQSARGASVLQLWREDGSILYRSPSLEERTLERHPRSAQNEQFSSEGGPGGHWRVIRMAFVSRIDSELQDPPSAPRLELALARDMSGVEAVMRRLHVVLAAIAIAAALLMLLMLRGVVGHSLKPLERLAVELETMNARDLSRRLGTLDVPHELESVVRRLNELLDRVRAAFERERHFSADIAHELRTPLAGLRSSIEVELSRPRDALHYEQALRESLAITLHMQDLVQTLLQLARLDGGLEPPQWIEADLATLTAVHLEPLRAQVLERQLTLERPHPGAVPVRTDPVLIGTAIRNILDNAVSHADQGGRVRVEVRAESGAGRLRVTNSGARVGPHDIPRLFERFARGDDARGAAGGHHGLGLALVCRIADSLGCTVEVRSEIGGDFEVELTLPATAPSGSASA